MSEKQYGRYDLILFDLHTTLYPPNPGLEHAVDARITRFVEDRLGLSHDEADALRRHYFCEYGATIRGLVEDHAIDPTDYYRYICDLDVASYLRPDAELARMLARLRPRAVVFTNAVESYARRVLDCVGLNGSLAAIYDIAAVGYRPKPDPQSYALILETEKVEPQRAIMVDDREMNLVPARDMGLLTVQVHTRPENGVAEVRLSRLSELAKALPTIFRRT